MVKQKRMSFRAVGASFAVILTLLVGGTLALVYLSGPTLLHFPSSLSLPLQPWMELFPGTAESMSMINFSAVRPNLGASSHVSVFLTVYQTAQSITSDNATMVATYNLPPSAPGLNSTQIFYFKLTSDAFARLTGSLESSTITAHSTYRDRTIYFIYNNNTGQGGLLNGRVSFVNDLIIYTQGDTAEFDLKNAIDVVVDNATSLFENATVQRAFYASTNNDTSFLGFTYVGYGTQVPGVQLGAKSVYDNGGKYQVFYAYMFKSLDASRAGFSNLTKVYSGGFNYYLMDEYVVAKFDIINTALLNQLQTF
jgi:hypothetical protein